VGDTIVFQQGFDYLVTVIGEFTEIAILPDGRIPDGSIVLIDYRAEVSPFTSTSTTRPAFNVSVDYGWITPYFRTSSVNRTLLSGADDGTVFDRRSRATGLQVRLHPDRLRVLLRAERRTEEGRNLSYTAVQAGQLLSFSFRPGGVLTVNLDEVATNFRVPERRETRESARVDFSWAVTPVLSLRAVSSARVRRDSAGFNESYYQAGFDATWDRRTLDLSTVISRDWGTATGRRFGGLRVGIRLSRPF